MAFLMLTEIGFSVFGEVVIKPFKQLRRSVNEILGKNLKILTPVRNAIGVSFISY